MCWLGDWIRLTHPMHWFQSLLRSSRRLKPQISHGFLAPFEGFPDASPSVLQVWENVGIHVIMGLSTGLCRIYGKTWDTGDHLSTLPYISVRCHATGHLVASLTGSTNFMGLSTGIPMARRLHPKVVPTPKWLSISPILVVRDL